MTDEQIKALAEESYPGQQYQRLFDAITITAGIAVQSEMDDIIRIVHEDFPLEGTELDEDEYVEKINAIMKANETGAIEAVVDEVIMPMKAAIRQYWRMVQTKHEEIRKLKDGTEVKEVWEAVSVEDELPEPELWCAQPTKFSIDVVGITKYESLVGHFNLETRQFFSKETDTAGDCILDEDVTHWLKKTTVRVVHNHQ